MELEVDAQPAFVAFRLLGSEGVVPPEGWAAAEPQLAPRLRAALRQLMLLVEEEKASVGEDGSVGLPHDVVAPLSTAEAAQLGLAEPMPHTLQIDSRGRVDEPGFRLTHRWFDVRGRAVFPGPRVGALVPVGERTYRLAEPLFSLIEAIDRYNAAPPEDLKERFLAVGRIRELMPEGTVLDGYLDTIRVARATAFTLEPYVDESGQLTFDPVLMRPETPQVRAQPGDAPPPAAPAAPRYVPSLPPHFQEEFARQFRRRTGDLARYALPGG